MTSLHRSGVVRVAAPLPQAFACFTPEGERRWVDGWMPHYLAPADAGAELREGLAFRTRHGDETTLWFVSRLEAANGVVDYVRVTPGSRMGRVSIRCYEADAGVTDVTVTYELTALSVAGERLLDEFAGQFDAMLRDWERWIAGAMVPETR
jgi:hypothetical protein